MFLCCRLLNSRQPVQSRTLLSVTSTLLLPSTQCRSYRKSTPPSKRRKFRRDKIATDLVLNRLKEQISGELSEAEEHHTSLPKETIPEDQNEWKVRERKEDGYNKESKPAQITYVSI